MGKEYKAERKTKYSSEILKKSKKYLSQCNDEYIGESDGRVSSKLKVNLPTVEGLALFLNVHRDTLYEWSKKYSEFSDTMRRLKYTQHDRIINASLSGHYNPTIAKLMLCNNFNYKEKSDVTTNNHPVTDFTKLTDEELREIISSK